jgi:hypothetical protein
MERRNTEYNYDENIVTLLCNNNRL